MSREEVEKEIAEIGWKMYIIDNVENKSYALDSIARIEKLYQITIDFDTCFAIVDAVKDEIVEELQELFPFETDYNISEMLYANMDTHTIIGVGAG